MPLTTFGQLFGTTETLKALKARVKRLAELQSLYVRTAPRELAGSSRVKGCRAGTLFVFADNAAVAAKLKQLAPRLLAAIRETEAEINQIRIEVQVRGRQGVSFATSRKKPLSEATVRRFGALAQTMPEGPLKAAVARLAARHQAALDEDQPLEHVKKHRDDHDHERELHDAPRPREVAPVAGVEVKADRKRDRKQS
ncbi:MAG TPA: DciA family protein [Burkholderiales bacterium]|nr:DciA family protein [Burkholderiales bacterium]